MVVIFLVLVEPVATVKPAPSGPSMIDMVWRWSDGHVNPWM